MDKIEYRVFYEINDLVSVVIPPGITSIGREAFGHDTILTIYGEEGSYAESYAPQQDPPIAFKPWSQYTAVYTVLFDASGGTVGTKLKDVTSGKTYGTLPVPKRSGYQFAGWYTSSLSGNH